MQGRNKNAIIVFNKEKYHYHAPLAVQLKNVLENRGYDVLMGDVSRDGKSVYGEVSKDEADILVTFDLEGFEKGTESGSLFYNLLTCKMVHFLFGDKEAYFPYLSHKLSLAMLFFGVGMSDGEVEQMKGKYPNIYYLHPTADIENVCMEDVFVEVEKELTAHISLA